MIRQTLLKLALLVPSIGFAVDPFEGTSLTRTASLSPTNDMEKPVLPETTLIQETEPPTQEVRAKVCQDMKAYRQKWYRTNREEVIAKARQRRMEKRRAKEAGELPEKPSSYRDGKGLFQKSLQQIIDDATLSDSEKDDQLKKIRVSCFYMGAEVWNKSDVHYKQRYKELSIIAQKFKQKFRKEAYIRSPYYQAYLAKKAAEREASALRRQQHEEEGKKRAAERKAKKEALAIKKAKKSETLKIKAGKNPAPTLKKKAVVIQKITQEEIQAFLFEEAALYGLLALSHAA